MKRIGIVVHDGSERSIGVARGIRDYLIQIGRETLLAGAQAAAALGVENVDIDLLAARSELIVVLGGDGAFLGLARRAARHSTPLLGVNLGSLGFLTSCKEDEAIDALGRALDGERRFEERIMIECDISASGKILAREELALNDVVINRASFGGMVKVNVIVDGVWLNDYIADGLIISTPTGSTAYNLSANGPIIHPSLDVFIVNPICPHTLSNRPIALPASASITLTLAESSRAPSARLTLDGQIGHRIEPGAQVRLRKSSRSVRVVSAHKSDYYALLRAKLKWGASIGDRSSIER